jgi:hypothetical protein
MRARFGLFAYPWDFDRATLERRLTAVKALGMGRLVIAVLYHDGRQLLPAGPERVVWVEGGRSYVPLTESRYPPGLVPPPAAAEPSLEEIAAAARALALDVEAWTVTLHRDDLVRARSDRLPLVENVFGERHRAHLCPSAEETFVYLHAHLEDIAAAGFDRVVLEGCHFPPLAHGYHHESLLAPLGPLDRWLLSLCFCPSCDGEAVRPLVATMLEAKLAGSEPIDPAPVDPDALDPALRALFDARCDAVTSLVARAREGLDLTVRFADQVAVAGELFRTGWPGPRPAALDGPLHGLRYTELAEVCDSVVALGYLSDVDALRVHVAAYLDLGVPPERLGVVLRPMPPDSATVDELGEKLELVRSLGVEQVDFYNLGFARESDLEMLRMAIS